MMIKTSKDQGIYNSYYQAGIKLAMQQFGLLKLADEGDEGELILDDEHDDFYTDAADPLEPAPFNLYNPPWMQEAEADGRAQVRAEEEAARRAKQNAREVTFGGDGGPRNLTAAFRELGLGDEQIREALRGLSSRGYDTGYVRSGRSATLEDLRRGVGLRHRSSPASRAQAPAARTTEDAELILDDEHDDFYTEAENPLSGPPEGPSRITQSPSDLAQSTPLAANLGERGTRTPPPVAASPAPARAPAPAAPPQAQSRSREQALAALRRQGFIGSQPRDQGELLRRTFQPRDQGELLRRTFGTATPTRPAPAPANPLTSLRSPTFNRPASEPLFDSAAPTLTRSNPGLARRGAGLAQTGQRAATAPNPTGNPLYNLRVSSPLLDRGPAFDTGPALTRSNPGLARRSTGSAQFPQRPATPPNLTETARAARVAAIPQRPAKPQAQARPTGNMGGGTRSMRAPQMQQLSSPSAGRLRGYPQAGTAFTVPPRQGRG